MKFLFVFLAFAATAAIGWNYRDVHSAKEAADAKLADFREKVLEAKMQLSVTNQKIMELASAPVPLSTPKPNWVEERNKNWKSSLNR